MGRGRLGWGDGEEEGKVEKSWQGPGVGRKRGRQEGGQEGVGWGGGDRIGTIGRRLGGGNGEGKMDRGQREGGDGRGARGGGEEGARGGGTLQMDMIQAHGMPGWNEVTEFSD